MRKQNTKKLILSVFLKSFGVILLMFLVGFGSYKLTMFFYNATDKNASKGSNVKDLVSDATADDISRNLIYSVNEQTKQIDKIVIEVLNINTNNLDYVTIPASTQITVPNDLYKKLTQVNPQTPQIITLSDLQKYFSGDTGFAYGVLMIESSFSFDIGYYMAMPNTIFDQTFDTSQVTDLSNTKVDVYTLGQSVISRMNTFTDAEQYKEYLQEQYNSGKSNLTLKKRQNYADAFKAVDKTMIYKHLIPGKMANGVFTPDTEQTSALYKQILSNDKYMSSQSETEKGSQNVASSKGLKIQILNGSKITGLAATYKSTLEKDGYTVDSTGNYDSGVVTNTRILVSKNGMGKDLQTYFTNAVIEESELQNGIDIQIILGTADNKTGQ